MGCDVGGTGSETNETKKKRSSGIDSFAFSGPNSIAVPWRSHRPTDRVAYLDCCGTLGCVWVKKLQSGRRAASFEVEEVPKTGCFRVASRSSSGVYWCNHRRRKGWEGCSRQNNSRRVKTIREEPHTRYRLLLCTVPILGSSRKQRRC